MDWTKVKHFKPKEFSEDPDLYADPKLIYILDDFRQYLDERMYPSTHPGALARFDDKSKASQHYAKNRKSKAIDGFLEGQPLYNFYAALSFGRFKGIGIYIDTHFSDLDASWAMFHLDIRTTGFGPYPLIWMRSGPYRYLYPQLNEIDRHKFERCLKMPIMAERKEL